MRTAALLAQVFVGTTLVTGLLLAASREANRALEAERLERAREQREALLGFAGRVAHDLQGPLSVVEGWTTELAAAVQHDPLATAAGVPAMTDRILGAARQARSLVADLLADAAARDRAPVRTCVDLTALANDVAQAHTARADIVIGDVGTVAGDAALLRQVLGNLIDNAAKYVREGARATIAVTGRRVGDVLVVRVTDDGVGVPPGQHERIFDEFERARADSYPGTGLGLSICRRIVERHGGRIHAFDRDDGRTGAVFELTLPAWGADLRPRPKVTT